MDFGVLGFDGVVGLASSSSSSDPHGTKQTLFGSGLFSNKHERSCNNNSNDNSSNEEDGFCRNFKAARTDRDEQQKNNSDNCTYVLKPNDAPYLFSECHPPQKMLSFSCPNKSEPQNTAFPCLPFTPSPYTYSRYTDWNRGPFTASQKMELEQQAMIYKYLSANMPVPSNLLLPIRNAFISAGYSNFLPGISRPTSWGWGTFHLGYSNSTDPEPGRCRRTDGKKWRCSRDAVPDHKYCERHMNRGRHRSRKPVEGHQQLPAHSSTTTTTAAAAAPAATARTVSSASMRPISTSGLTSVALQPAINRMFMNREKPNSQFKESPFLITEHQNPFEQASQTELGFMCSDSLLNTSSHNINNNNKPSVSSLPEQESSHNHPLLQFMDNFPLCRSSDSDNHQLLDFMSSTSSPNNDIVTNTISPLRLSDHRQGNYFPTSWESSLGGPLGEVLHNGSSTDCQNNNRINNNNSSSSGRVNLAAVDGGWGGSSGQSSPRGVLLHRTVFGNSLSNSSAGSSPRTGDSYSKTHETAAGLF